MRPPESFIGQPVRSLQTMLRVLAEDDNTLPTVVPDGIYGQDTLSAVSAFQRRHGLPVTGVTDNKTWDKIVEAYEPALVRVGKAAPIEIILNPGQIFRRGDSSPYLYLAQSMLTVLANDLTNLEAPSHSGVLDSTTADALAAFQILAGLPPTGELDKQTWKYLVNQFTLLAKRAARSAGSDRG